MILFIKFLIDWSDFIDVEGLEICQSDSISPILLVNNIVSYKDCPHLFLVEQGFMQHHIVCF